MNFYSTNKKTAPVTFKEAVFKSIAADGGLYVPEKIPKLPPKFFEHITKLSYSEIAFEVLSPFLDEVKSQDLQKIIKNAFNFDAPLKEIDKHISVLELFHGPTLAFKDFGARFMAQILSFFAEKNDKEINILVATSGDTGSAVASAFYDIPGIKVMLLYPGDKVSQIQEKQLTTFNNNITALEVNGTFDDCQRLVKTAFLNKELNTKLTLSSANSINIARLLPQAVYYFSAYAQLKNTNPQIIISVPSGNLGNLTGGVIAKKMGLPILHYLAALNSNTVFYDYLKTGEFNPRSSIRTISNAMDVGNPSNFHRITEFFANNVEEIRNLISAEYFSDDETKKEIKRVYEKFGYLIDPHGAVGFLALGKFIEENNMKDYKGIVLETAHPAKFIDVMEEVVEKDIPMPERLKNCLTKEKKSIKISNQFEDFKELLMN